MPDIYNFFLSFLVKKLIISCWEIFFITFILSFIQLLAVPEPGGTFKNILAILEYKIGHRVYQIILI